MIHSHKTNPIPLPTYIRACTHTEVRDEAMARRAEVVYRPWVPSAQSRIDTHDEDVMREMRKEEAEIMAKVQAARERAQRKVTLKFT